jgi:glycosyltransferase involved in cell wall biosynthesis
MKILLMNALWGQTGGKEQYVLDCVEEFTRMGHECSLVYSRASSRPGQTNLPLIRRYAIATFSDITSVKDTWGAEQLAGVLRDEAPDVIFMRDVRNLRLLTVLKNYGGLVPMSHDNWLTCMRVISTTYFRRTICTHTCGYRCLLHGCFLRKNPAGSGIVYNSLFQHRALLESYKDINIHLVASNYLKKRLVQHGFNPDQVKVVGDFTDVQPSTSVAVNESVPGITFVGRIDRYKGVDYLMRALAQLSIPFRCSVIGDGAYLPHCKELSRKLGIADCVDFTGWLSRDKVTERLSTCSMVVVPSICPEQFARVGLEAMTCSKPVVAFDVGGISDWLKDGTNGYLVPVKRVDLLAQRIEELLRDRQKAANMGAEGFRIVKTVFSRERHFDHLLSAFEFAAHTRRRGTA